MTYVRCAGAALTAACATLLATPTGAHAQVFVPAETPPGTTFEIVETVNTPMIASGALMFAASYGASVVVASTSDRPAAERLYVPLAGPWLALRDWDDCPLADPRCDVSSTQKFLLVADGLFQAAGLLTVVTGLMTPMQRIVYRRTADSLKLRPTSNGFALSGTF
jgi:hypothetical protein